MSRRNDRDLNSCQEGLGKEGVKDYIIGCVGVECSVITSRPDTSIAGGSHPDALRRDKTHLNKF